MGFVLRNKATLVRYKKTKRHRNFLIIEKNENPQSTVIVIMKNPSTTCINMQNGKRNLCTYAKKAKCRIDRTTGKVYRLLTKKGYDRIVVLNLFSLYETYTTKVNLYYNGVNSSPDLLKNSDNAINQILKKYPTAPIVCAWGGNSKIDPTFYQTRIRHVLSILQGRSLNKYCTVHKAICSYDPKLHGLYPPHGLMWK